MHNYDERTDKIGEMLESEDKQLSSIPPRMENVLSRLFRRILMMERMNKLMWNSYMQSYVRMVENNTKKVSVHGNTTKALVKKIEDENKETHEAEEAKYHGIE